MVVGPPIVGSLSNAFGFRVGLRRARRRRAVRRVHARACARARGRAASSSAPTRRADTFWNARFNNGVRASSTSASSSSTGSDTSTSLKSTRGAGAGAGAERARVPVRTRPRRRPPARPRVPSSTRRGRELRSERGRRASFAGDERARWTCDAAGVLAATGLDRRDARALVVELPTARATRVTRHAARGEIAFGARRVVVDVDEPRLALRRLETKGRGGRSAAARTCTKPPLLCSVSPGPVWARNHDRGSTSRVHIPARTLLSFPPAYSSMLICLLSPRNIRS